MRLRFTSSLLAAMLATALMSGFGQDQQPGKGQNPPDSSAPQSSAPQNIPQTPPGSDTQGAPAQSKPEQVAPNPGEAAPPNQSSPATREQAPRQEEAQPAPGATPEASNPAKPKPSTQKTAQRNKRKRKTSAQAKSVQRPKTTKPLSTGEPGKVVVRNGGASDDVVHLSPGGSQEQEAHNRENTEQLLATTNGNLKMLASRQLSPAEQSTVDQIHSYMRQAKSAANSGDLARAHTLAFKAHLLSDDLAKR